MILSTGKWPHFPIKKSVRVRSLLTYHYLQLSAIKLHPRCIRMIHWKTKLYNHWVSLEAWTTPKVRWTFGGTTIPSQAGIPAFRYNRKVHVVRTTTPLCLTIFKFHLWSFSFLPSSHDRLSLPFTVTEGGLGMCCQGYHLATTHQSHHSFQVFSWPPSCHNWATPSFAVSAGGLGAYCRDYHPTMSGHFQLLFMDIFIPTIQPQSIVPAFCCNSGVCAIEAITLLQLTNLTIHFRSFHDHHPTTIKQPHLSL